MFIGSRVSFFLHFSSKIEFYGWGIELFRSTTLRQKQGHIHCCSVHLPPTCQQQQYCRFVGFVGCCRTPAHSGRDFFHGTFFRVRAGERSRGERVCVGRPPNLSSAAFSMRRAMATIRGRISYTVRNVKQRYHDGILFAFSRLVWDQGGLSASA